MKAQEYFDKYFAKGFSNIEELSAACHEVLKDFSREVTSLIEQRGVKTDAGAVGVIRELNTKWNSLAGKVEEKFGVKVLRRNTIWNTYLAGELGYDRKPD